MNHFRRFYKLLAYHQYAMVTFEQVLFSRCFKNITKRVEENEVIGKELPAFSTHSP